MKKESYLSLFLRKVNGDRVIKYLLILPLVVIMLGVVVYPLLFSIRLSSCSASLQSFREAKFWGLQNYLRLFGREELFRSSIWFTVFYTVVVVGVEFLTGLGLALLINRRILGKRIIIILLMIPMMVAPVIYGIQFRLMLNSIYGVIPYYFSRIGLNIPFLENRLNAQITLMTVDILQWIPFMFLILYAGLQALPIDPYDAALVDGATKSQVFYYITLPLMQPIIILAIVLRTMDAFKVFDTIYVITAGGPGTSTVSTTMYVCQLLFGRFDLGMAAAMTVIMLILIIIISQLFINYLYRYGWRTR